MGNENYREAFENDRQEISLNPESSPSRRAQRNAAKQKPKQNKSLLLPVLFFIFILIPVMVLIYVAFLYEPTEPVMEAAPNNEVSVETNTASAGTPQLVVADDEEDDKEQADAEAAVKKEQAEQEQAAKEAEEREAAEKEAAAKAQADKQAAAKAEAERKAAEEAQAEALKREQEKEAAEKKEKEAQQTPPASQKTHVVQQNETLYRIAVNNYGAAGAGAAVERIKQANGLSSNEISVGQTLVLP